MPKLPKREDLKTWSTSKLITVLAQLVTIDVTGKGKITEFDDANSDHLESFYNGLVAEIDARIPVPA